ncbi:MAG: type I DNA topoisomerase [Candidatus Omnitrophica bacterium]|nr:type I DNA topoisomerase [Candidatus Omnitrophota bacterium]
MKETLVGLEIKVNGERRRIPRGTSVASLLTELKINPRRVVVEVNETILPRECYAERALKERDVVEIIHFVGGGATKSLVIVESPAKSKTIHQILGDRYVVLPSMGHVIDLPTSAMGVDVEKNFEPTYVVIKGKKKLLNNLKKEAKGMDAIYLAPDPDREGEAISWHLKNYLGNHQNIHRVVFHEITHEAVLEAFKHPTDIDLKKVNAQQARRILDRIVGYSLSPLLWKKVGKGLSAGRVQSVAVRLVVDREKEIQGFTPKEYWELEANLSPQKEPKKHFLAKLEKLDGEKAELGNKEAVEAVTKKLEGSPFIVQEIRKSEKKKSPPAPFTTSKLQQDAFNKLHFSAAKTMRLAQQLYEGLEVGKEGPVGLITYMRTDSVRVSDTAISQVREFIGKKFGKEYLPKTPHRYVSKKTAQEAHEAIRPTSVFREPDGIKPYLTQDQYKLYRLIYCRFVASQMEKANFLVVSVDIACGVALFRASHQSCLFPGFLSVYATEEEEEVKERLLPELLVGQPLTFHEFLPSQHFTKPPPRYTEGSLVKALEELGIGRPSTYAPTLQTIIQRDYVRREKGSLVPTELGNLVTKLLIENFPKILDIQFTATMEEELDGIEEGRSEWVEVLKEFYGPFAERLSEAKVVIKREVVETEEKCEKCGRPMVIKWGRSGKFLSCSGFPECKNARSITTGVACPSPGCGGELVARRSKKGRFFYGCSRYPQCTFTSSQLPTSKEKPKEGEEVA